MSFEAARLLIFLLVSIPCSIYDCLKYRVILSLVVAGIVCLAGCQFLYFGSEFNFFARQCLYSLIASVLILILARIFTSNGLGLGDVVFGAFCSFFTGYLIFTFIALGISSILGLMYFTLFSFTRKRKSGRGMIISHYFVLPYIPFMTAGTLITYFLLWINWLNF